MLFEFTVVSRFVALMLTDCSISPCRSGRKLKSLSIKVATTLKESKPEHYAIINMRVGPQF